MSSFSIILVVLAALVIIYVLNGIKIVSQSETMIVERLGRYHRTLQAGINIILPIVDRPKETIARMNTGALRMVSRIDLREQVCDFDMQSVITKDNVMTDINALLYFQVVDPVKSVYEIKNLPMAIEKLTQTTLRNVVGEMELYETLTSRETINSKLRNVLDEATNKWGVKVNRVELQDITPLESIRFAMEKQMQAERNRRAEINAAEAIPIDLARDLYDYPTLDGWVEEQKKNNLVWTGDTSNGIKVPVGYVSKTETFDFYIANQKDADCKDFFALIAGRPGYGKTVLLHNIIVNAALKYSPEELHFYLADFAHGASFASYKNLPHVKALMIANNKEYTLSMLKDLEQETNRRSQLFQEAFYETGTKVENLAAYRDATGKKLPLIVLIIDDFDYLFINSDFKSIEARSTLCNAIRQWRKFGISVILSTQSISGVRFGEADKMITYRFALNSLAEDSRSIIGNAAAASLTRKGQTIMNNTADGNVAMNVEFQAAYSEHYEKEIAYLAELYKKTYGTVHKPDICETRLFLDIAENASLLTNITKDGFVKNAQYCDVYLGKPDLLRATHTRIRYQRRQLCNTLMVGDDLKTMAYTMAVQLVQLYGCSSAASKFYVVDAFNVGDTYYGVLDDIVNLSEGFELVTPYKIPAVIDNVLLELERRKEALKEGAVSDERIVLTIMNAQECEALKPQKAKYGVERSETTEKLVRILNEGGSLGIHCIIHCLSYQTMFDTNAILSSKEFSLFTNYIFFKGSDVDYYKMGSSCKFSSPEEAGRMVVFNGKLDAENYEQCQCYSEITLLGKANGMVDYLSNLFNKLRYN